MRRPWASRLAVLTFIASAAVSSAQQVPAPPPPVGETLDVSLINVDVHVTDRAGKRVHGLTADDFILSESGREQPISNFTEYGAARAESASSSAPEGPRSVVIFIDDLRAHPINAKPVFAAIKQFVRDTIRRGDSVTIVRWETSAQTALEFTDDVAKAGQVLDRIGRESALPYRQFDEVQQAVSIGERPMMGGDGRAPLRSPESRNEGVLRVRALEEKTQLTRKIAAINATINSLSTGDGKKALLLVTHRLSMFAGGEYFYASGHYELPIGVAQELDMRPVIDTIIENANANGVTVYPIYPEGLTLTQSDAERAVPGSFDASLLANETPMLERVAAHTGGLTAWGGRNIPKLLPEAASDFESYYSLAYRVPPIRVDRTRDVVVKARNPEYVVRARRTYVERSDATRMLDRVTAALFRNMADVSFVMAVDAGPRRDDIVPISIRVPIAKLTALPQDDGSEVAWLSVWAATATRNGDASVPVSERRTFRIAPGERAAANAGYLTYTLDVVVPRGADRLAIGVLDEVSKAYSLERVKIPARGAQAAAQR